jgi:glucose-6-phosphate dehydrogenase assembly protein OpcA
LTPSEPLQSPIGSWNVEQLLTDALRPLEPPERLSGKLEDTLSAVTQAAAEELSEWAEELSESELRALRDPRNWVRPVVAVGAGGAAAGALLVLELRRRGRQQAKGGLRSLAGRVRP